MSILFVRGFNTEMDKHNTYSNFNNFFALSTYKLDYFDYSPRDELDTVYSNLCKKITDGSYTILMGHSLGGGLLLKFLTDHRDCIPKFDKIIFLMPYISTSLLYDLLFSIPYSQEMYVPYGLYAPNRCLVSTGNFLNDSYGLVPLKQISTMHHKYIPNMDLTILNQKNCILICAESEKITPIPTNTLAEFDNKIILKGKHEMYRDKNDSQHFFLTLKTILSTI